MVIDLCKKQYIIMKYTEIKKKIFLDNRKHIKRYCNRIYASYISMHAKWQSDSVVCKSILINIIVLCIIIYSNVAKSHLAHFILHIFMNI